MDDKENKAPSNVIKFEDITEEVPKTGDSLCPLCSAGKFKANKPNKAVKHLKLSHWKHRVAVNGKTSTTTDTDSL